MSGTLGSIYDNISWALHLHSEALFRLQEQASTGSRINRVSDDPADACRVLELYSQESSLQNYMDNTSKAIDMLEHIAGVGGIIGQIRTMIADKRTSISQIMSGTFDESSRQSAGDEINEALEHIFSLANTSYMNQYLFGGSNTSSAPYVAERSNGEITSVSYQGSSEERKIAVSAGVESTVVYAGEELFCSNSRSTPVFVGSTGAAAGTGTSSVTGDVWLKVRDNGGYELSIDDGASWHAAAGANTAVTDTESGKVLYVDTTGITATGTDLVRVPGTYDIFGTLISARDILRNEQGLSGEQLNEVRETLLNSLTEVMDLLVRKETSIGSRIGLLSDFKDTVEDMKYKVSDEADIVQQADIAQVAIDISRREILYQMSLSMAGRVLSLSLLDFIT